MESVYEDHERDSRSCSMLHMEESAQLRPRERSAPHDEEDDRSSGDRGRDGASHRNSNSSAGHRGRGAHQAAQKPDERAPSSASDQLMMQGLEEGQSEAKVAVKPMRKKISPSAAASACHWELKPFSQMLLDVPSKTCSR